MYDGNSGGNDVNHGGTLMDKTLSFTPMSLTTKTLSLSGYVWFRCVLILYSLPIGFRSAVLVSRDRHRRHVYLRLHAGECCYYAR